MSASDYISDLAVASSDYKSRELWTGNLIGDFV
jgi:hypothetical protein